VLATPTASGKSLAYMVPALEQAIETGANTLYLGPQVALINDHALVKEIVGSDCESHSDRSTLSV
jgi:ATP-dependent helicase YprA (DUF1998 family)